MARLKPFSFDEILPSHVVAALLQLNHRSAPVALLPALLPGLFEGLVCGLVVWALPRYVPFASARCADLGVAPSASAHGTVTLPRYLLRLDPRSAFSRWAVQPVPSGMLYKLVIPNMFKVLVEEMVHMLQWDDFLAALGRHILRICNR